MRIISGFFVIIFAVFLINFGQNANWSETLLYVMGNTLSLIGCFLILFD